MKQRTSKVERKMKIITNTSLLCILGLSLSGFSFNAFASPENILLYKEPHYVPSHCEKLTQLSLDYTEKTALLEDVLVGVCPGTIDPNPRKYQLLEIYKTAASIISSGTILNFPAGSIVISDLRNSVTTQNLDALVKVTEIGAMETHYFSNP